MRVSIWIILICLLPIAQANDGSDEPGTSATDPVGENWLAYVTPEAAGWSSAALVEAKSFSDSVGSSAVMVVERGKVVASWGAVTKQMKSYSVRKSLLGLLYGEAIAAGEVALATTVGELGLDDIDPLLPVEKRATVAQLLDSTSAIYHPAAKEPPSLTSRPSRGEDRPGSRWWYNNWGFNVALTVYENTTNRRLAAAFMQNVAKPIGMQDLSADDIFYVYEPRKSVYPAYEFLMSARDLARVGVLMALQGKWSDRQVVPHEWVDLSVEKHWEFNDESGYGYLWWINPGRLHSLPPNDTALDLGRVNHVAALGSFGQLVLIIPEQEIVIVHRAQRENNGGVSDPDVFALAQRILAAKHSALQAGAEIEPARFEAVPPEQHAHKGELVAPSPEEIERLTGRYHLSDEQFVDVYEWREMLFITGPRAGEADLQLLKKPDGQFTSRSLPVTIRFERQGGGDLLELRLGNRKLLAVRKTDNGMM